MSHITFILHITDLRNSILMSIIRTFYKSELALLDYSFFAVTTGSCVSKKTANEIYRLIQYSENFIIYRPSYIYEQCSSSLTPGVPLEYKSVVFFDLNAKPNTCASKNLFSHIINGPNIYKIH